MFIAEEPSISIQLSNCLTYAWVTEHCLKISMVEKFKSALEVGN